MAGCVRGGAERGQALFTAPLHSSCLHFSLTVATSTMQGLPRYAHQFINLTRTCLNMAKPHDCNIRGI